MPPQPTRASVIACLLLGLVFAHATNNLLNDLTDHLKGVDKDNYFRAQYGPQPLEHGLLTIREHLGSIACSGVIALAAGIYLVAVTGGVTLSLFAAGIFFVLFYTWPLKYYGIWPIYLVAYAFRYNRVFGLLFLIGLIIDLWLR